MPTWVPVLVTVGLFIASASLGFAFKTMREATALRSVHETLAEEHGNLLKCVPEMQQQIARLAQNDEVFWKVIGPHMSAILQSPEHLTRDHLIRRLDEGTLTYPQALQLNSALGHAIEDARDNMVKVALAFKLAQVRCVLLDMDRKYAADQNKEDHGCHHSGSMAATPR